MCASIPYGDIDADQKITASDALMALQHSVRLITLEQERFVAGDVNGDKVIDAVDALLILQLSVKQIESIPRRNEIGIIGMSRRV